MYAEQDMPSHAESAASGLPGLEGFMAGRGDPYPGGGDGMSRDITDDAAERILKILQDEMNLSIEETYSALRKASRRVTRRVRA